MPPHRPDEINQEVSKLVGWLELWTVTDDGFSTKSPLDQAISRLKQLGPDVVPFLIEHLKLLLSTDPPPRYHGDYSHLYKTMGTIRALGEIGDPRAADVVISALGSSGYSGDLAGTAAEALQHIPTARAIASLLEALVRQNQYSNNTAPILEALIKCGVDAGTARARLQGLPESSQIRAFRLLSRAGMRVGPEVLAWLAGRR